MKYDYCSIFDIPKIQTKINKVLVKNEKVYINFETCNLRPTFAGQLFDKGKFYNGKWFDINDVVYIDNKIFCLINEDYKEFKLNETILLEMDLERRCFISRMHSAVHLTSYINKDQMINGYAGVKKSRVDFKGDFEQFQTNFYEMQKKFESIVKNNEKINIKYLNKDKVDISKINEFKNTDSNLCRIVEIDNLGSSMCYGTHMRNTNEIGSIKFDKPTIVKDDIYKLNLLIE